MRTAAIPLVIVAATLCWNASCAKRPKYALPGALIAAAPVQSPELRDWLVVQRVQSGTRIRVKLISGEDIVGRLLSADSEGTTVQVAESQRTIKRAEVARLFSQRDRRIGKAAARGFLIGASAGILQGLLLTESNKAAWAAMLAAGWGAIGIVVGIAVESATGGESLVFER